MKAVHFILFSVVAALAVLSACDSLPIDRFTSFNLVKTADFVIPAGSSADLDTGIVVTKSIDFKQDYTANKTDTSLLGTAKVTRFYLQSSDPAFRLGELVYAQVLIGGDTVAMDSIPFNTGGIYQLKLTDRDIVKQLKDTSYTATLRYKLRTATTSQVTLGSGMTIVYTAQPL